MSSTPAADRVAKSVDELLAEYATPDACLAELLCDRHDPQAVAFKIVGDGDDGSLEVFELTYGQLREDSEKAAAALAEMGVQEGDSVATLMAKSRDLVTVLVGLWRLGAVHVPMFTAFAWPAIQMRLEGSSTKVIVCDPDQRAKIEDTSAQVVLAGSGQGAKDGDLILSEALASAGAAPAAARRGSDATMVILYTSGTTGTPKGVMIPIRALAAFHQYMEVGLDVTDEDVFWNAADPGWAYGLYYGILGPLATGHTNILMTAKYTPAKAMEVLEQLKVTNFAAAPTIYRTIRADFTDPTSKVRLRCASSAGEPLTPEVVTWSREFFGCEVRDQYGQTEHGMFIINPWHPQYQNEARVGSMGVPLPGWECEVLDALEDVPMKRVDMNSAEADDENLMGRVAIDAKASPMMWFKGYLDAPDKTAERFSPDKRWYYTGDAGKRDQDGMFYFASRDDDVVIMAGYRIGPFDVESVLAQDPDVVESAVIGVPDALRGEVLEAFVVLRGGIPADDATADAKEKQLQQLVKTEFAAHAYPRAIHFVRMLPKTPSGKIQRFVLRKERSEGSA